MKRMVSLLLCVALLVMLALPVLATEDNLKIHTATAKKGEAVYVTVELTESTVGNAVAVMYSYNEKHLKPVPASCSWVQAGLLQDFDREDSIGVWAAAESMELKGGVCVLAFEVKSKFAETQISCTVTVKDGAKDVGEFSATGKVILDCEHAYEQWQDGGMIGHYRVCSLCHGQQTQNHQWDDGKTVTDPDHPQEQIKVFTCQICGATKNQKQEQSNPIFPEVTEPGEETKPSGPSTQWDPNQQQTEPNRPQQTQPGDNNGNPEIPHRDPDWEDEHAGHEHEGENTIPQDATDQLQQDDTHAGHEHGDAGKTDMTAIIIVVGVVLVALVVAMVFFVKKNS